MTEDSEMEESQDIADSVATIDARVDSVIDLADWIIPVGELECHERETRVLQPHPVSEITATEEKPLSLQDTTKASPEPIPEEKPFLFIRNTKSTTSPRSTRHSDRESLGQLAFDF